MCKIFNAALFSRGVLQMHVSGIRSLHLLVLYAVSDFASFFMYKLLQLCCFQDIPLPHHGGRILSWLSPEKQTLKKSLRFVSAEFQ
jgi:hypothetical protein